MLKKYLLVALITFSSIPAFSLEFTEQFVETFRTDNCKDSRKVARDRATTQIQSGSDIYAGPIKEFTGRKIIRFIQGYEGCEAVWSSAQGMLYDYRLVVQVAPN